MAVSDNPYQPSTTLSSDPAPQAVPLRRPTGIWLVMFLFLLVGVTRLGLSIYFFSVMRRFELTFAIRLAVAISILAAVAGMFLTKRWGWLLATTLAVWGVLNQLWALLGATQSASDEMIPQVAMLLTFAFATGSVLVYLYRSHVLEHFHVPIEKRSVILIGQAAIWLFVLIGGVILRRII